ncbi:4-hydroxy-tetrahydrodipicolinate reductase [Clostridium tetani]|nr:4-hydroxy-tetrahydrodipicolinate reductase [Clostridium tetani]QBD87985.1 4-hydroxy-tetrahydrodipicolinate reductase [Clostridium tetani]
MEVYLMVRIMLVGCNGKMGRIITHCSKDFNDIEIVAGVDKSSTSNLDFPVFENIHSSSVECDVVLDFSRPSSLKSLISYCTEKKLPLVLCTTGYSKEELNLIEETSKNIPIFKSANMSIGINVINSILKDISKKLYKDFDIEIIEKHHNQKVDSPSGTALLLADTIKDNVPEKLEYIYGRSGHSKRTKNEIGIHAIRGGSIVGDHDVIFAGIGECIEIKHTAISREVFAIGALKASAFMKGKPSGMYNMDCMLDS